MAGLRKDNRGFDLKQLFIGSEGTLGIVTKVKLKLVSAVRQRITVWAGVDSLAEARRLLLHCEGTARCLAGRVRGAATSMPRPCAGLLARGQVSSGRVCTNGMFLWSSSKISAAGPSNCKEAVEICLAEAADVALLNDAVLASNDTQAEQFWSLREAIAPAEKVRGAAVQHDIAVAPEAMPEMVEHLTQEIGRRWPDHHARAFGHLGDGNIHFHVAAPADPPHDWEQTTALQISAFVYDDVTRAGGTISAEHGIGQDKLDTLARTGDPVALDLMRAMKSVLDPAGLLNPGKLVPLAPSLANP